MRRTANSLAYRTVNLVLLTALLAGCAGSSSTGTARAVRTGIPASAATSPASAAPASAFAQLERRFGARLGVYVLDTGTGQTVTFQADERFAYCSTFKVLAAGILLERATNSQLSRVITYPASDLVENSPVTSRQAGTGMTLRDLMAAALE